MNSVLPSCLSTLARLEVSLWKRIIAFVTGKSKNSQPQSISVKSSGAWNNLEGSWSTFSIKIGTPPQRVQVLPSTGLAHAWVVETSYEDPSHLSTSSHPQSHGEFFDSQRSTTWHDVGDDHWNFAGTFSLFPLGTEDDLSKVGLDFYRVDDTDATASLELQFPIFGTVGAHSSRNNFLGLNYRSGIFDNYDHACPSFLATLKSKNLIPSLSYGYTAGAAYRSPHLRSSLGSLTLGGYDSARFLPNGASFPISISDDVVHDLAVELRSIEFSRPNGTTMSLLSTPIVAYFDSTAPEIWLPPSACGAFEKAFGLKWEDESQLYLVEPETHLLNSAQNFDITFNLTNSGSPESSVAITFPYASFDLGVISPLASQSKRYFPLRRAASDSQHTLGRTFLQESYLFVDYEKATFSVSQANWAEAEPEIHIQEVHTKRVHAMINTAPVYQGLTSLGRSCVAGFGFSAVTISAYAISIVIFTALLHKWRYKSRKSISPSMRSVRGRDIHRNGQSMVAARPWPMDSALSAIDSLIRGTILYKYVMKNDRLAEYIMDTSLNRVYWRCSFCGALLYDDFETLAPGAVEQFNELSDHRELATAPTTERHDLAQTAVRRPWTADNGTSLPLPIHQDERAPDGLKEVPRGSNSENKFLLLCLPCGEFGVRLSQENLSIQGVESDKDFFRLLKARSANSRGRSWLSYSVPKIKAIRFVFFNVDLQGLVDIRKVNSIPPENAADEYIYSPRPAKTVPPIGSNYLVHLLTHPDQAGSQSEYLRKIPLKLGPLAACTQTGVREGWGLQVVCSYSLNWTTLWIFGLVGLLASIIFGTLWSIYRSDVQGGFSVTACMMVCVVFTANLIQTSYTPETGDI